MASLLVLVLTASAAAGGAKTIDLDNDPDGLWRLAEAGGACKKGNPAFVRAWCRSGKPIKARFATQIDVTAHEATPEVLRVDLPATSHGKGMISSIVPPPIYCDAKVCLYPETIAVFVRTSAKVSAPDVRALAMTFDVDGIWRVRQWWGPKAENVSIRLLDAAGKQLGEAVLLLPTR